MSFSGRRAPPQLLVIHCVPAKDGLYYHNAYEGSMRVKVMGMDKIITDRFWLDAMRRKPVQFCDAMQEHEAAKAEQAGRVPPYE